MYERWDCGGIGEKGVMTVENVALLSVEGGLYTSYTFQTYFQLSLEIDCIEQVILPSISQMEILNMSVEWMDR